MAFMSYLFSEEEFTCRNFKAIPEYATSETNRRVEFTICIIETSQRF